MTVVLFVHGTGVRRASFDVTFDRFTTKLARLRPDLTIRGSYWGDICGSRLSMGGMSIPSGDTARGIGANESDESAEDRLLALWSVLEHDPLFELRSLSSDDAPIKELAPNAEPAGSRIAARCRALPDDISVAPLISAVGLESVFDEAIESVLNSSPAIESLRREAALGGSIRTSLARAFVAMAMMCSDRELDGTLPLDGAHRDELVIAIVAVLGGSDRGAGKFVFNMALNLGLTRPIERRRSAITNAASPAAGDVLMYLARGGQIREFINRAVIGAAEADPQVVIVGHSLGGIASFELLASNPIPEVVLLVTVGSQVSYLYELNALPMLEYPSLLPDSIPRWVNFFDARDLLSYVAADVFPGRATDLRIDNKAPFPRSHSAYFANDRFYELLSEVLPK